MAEAGHQEDRSQLDLVYFYTVDKKLQPPRMNVVWELISRDKIFDAVSMSRTPLRFVAVIDESFSMDDNVGDDDMSLIQRMKLFAELMVQNLKEDDQMAIVTFATDVQVKLPMTQLDKDGRVQALEAIKTLDTRGQTNLSDGLLAALDMFQSGGSFHNGIILFTDGQANQGITNTNGLIQAFNEKKASVCGEACLPISTFTIGQYRPHLLYEVSQKLGSDAFFWLSDDSNFEADMMIPIFLRETCLVSNVRVTLHALNGLTFEFKSMVSPLMTAETSQLRGAGTESKYFVHDISEDMKKHIQCVLNLPGDWETSLSGKDVVQAIVTYVGTDHVERELHATIPFYHDTVGDLIREEARDRDIKRSKNSYGQRSSLKKGHTLSMITASTHKDPSVSKGGKDIQEETLVSKDETGIPEGSSVSKVGKDIQEVTSVGKDGRDIPEATSVSKNGKDIPEATSVSKDGTDIPEATTVSKDGKDIPETTSVSKDGKDIPETTSVSKDGEDIPEATSVSKDGKDIPETTSVSKDGKDIPETTSVSKDGEDIPEATSVSKDGKVIPVTTSVSKDGKDISETTSVSKDGEDIPEGSLVISKDGEDIPDVTSVTKDDIDIPEACSYIIAHTSDLPYQQELNKVQRAEIAIVTTLQEDSRVLTANSINKAATWIKKGEDKSWVPHATRHLKEGINIITKTQDEVKTLVSPEACLKVTDFTTSMKENLDYCVTLLAPENFDPSHWARMKAMVSSLANETPTAGKVFGKNRQPFVPPKLATKIHEVTVEVAKQKGQYIPEPEPEPERSETPPPPPAPAPPLKPKPKNKPKSPETVKRLYREAKSAKVVPIARPFKNQNFTLSEKLVAGKIAKNSTETIKELVIKHGGTPVPFVHNSVLVCTKSEYKKKTGKVRDAITHKIPIVFEEFIYDSIKAKKMLDIDDYSF
ncbi:titin homolog [Branchiostoma lanceolatum]|uniref:titin homolog n=1 Tax=Branchiostoma lanceolatum TaxID=7740 RepID=UPI0034518A1F